LEWLDSQKAQVNASLTRVMLGIIAQHRVKGEWVDVEKNATKLLRFQPFNEEATLALAEAHAMRGEKLQATAILDRYLAEVGNGPSDLRLPATVMRRRIADRMHPHVESPLGQSALVGRSAEMRMLTELLLECRNNRGQSYFTWGDAGVGKTRLVSEFSAFAALQGVPTVRAQCRTGDKQRPLSIFIDLVPVLRKMRGAIGCSPESIQYLDRLTRSATLQQSEERHTEDLEFVYRKIEQAIFDLIDAVSDESCAIVLIEDVHWIDSASANILCELIEWASTRSILFVLTSRESPRSIISGVRNLIDAPLMPLDRMASASILRDIAQQHGREIDEEYLCWCLDVADGNPYFLQELAHQWVDQGNAYCVPSSLAAVLNDRIGRLSKDALLVLQGTSLLEKNCTFERIEKIIGFEAHRMLRAIDELGVTGMLLMESGERFGVETNRITSRHDLLSHAALSKLTAPARAFLHRRVGTVIEQEINEDRSASILWDCAKHWQMAGDLGRAFGLAKSCATHAMDLGLPTAAADAYRRALTFCTEPVDRLSILENLGVALYKGQEWTQLREVVPEFRELQNRLMPNAPRHDDLELMGIRAEWHYSPANEEPVQRALGCLSDESATSEHRLRAGSLALMLLDSQCRHELMHATYASVEVIAQNSDTSSSAYLEAKMVYNAVCGSLPVAAEAAREFLWNRRQRNPSGELCRDLCNASRVLRTAGFGDEAYNLLLESHTFAAEHKLTSSEAFDVPTIANWDLEKGNFESANRWYEKLVSIDERRGTPFERRTLATLGARIALNEGNVALARSRFDRTLDEILANETGQSRSYELAVYVAIDLFDHRVSRRAVNLLEESHLQSRRNMSQGFTAVVIGEALKQLGREERGNELVREYLNTFRRERLPLGLGIAKMFSRFPEGREKFRIIP
jgi:hypothetical protein